MSSSTPMGDPRPLNPSPETAGQTFAVIAGGGAGGPGLRGNPVTVEFGGSPSTAVPGTGSIPVLETQLGPHTVKQRHVPASRPTIAQVRALPDVASGDNFELDFVLGHSAFLPDGTLEHLRVMVQKYVLEDGDVVVTFVESVDFTIHDALLLPEPRTISGQIRCRTFNPQGDSRETWVRDFNQVRVVKSAGNTHTVQPYTITLRFSYRKPFITEPSE